MDNLAISNNCCQASNQSNQVRVNIIIIINNNDKMIAVSSHLKYKKETRKFSIHSVHVKSYHNNVKTKCVQHSMFTLEIVTWWHTMVINITLISKHTRFFNNLERIKPSKSSPCRHNSWSLINHGKVNAVSSYHNWEHDRRQKILTIQTNIVFVSD